MAYQLPSQARKTALGLRSLDKNLVFVSILIKSFGEKPISNVADVDSCLNFIKKKEPSNYADLRESNFNLSVFDHDPSKVLKFD